MIEDRDPRDTVDGEPVEEEFEYEIPDFSRDPDEERPEPPVSFWQALFDISRGLIALVAVSIFVLALYVAGGIFLGLLTWAAPAVLAVSAVIILARYLSRTR